MLNNEEQPENKLLSFNLFSAEFLDKYKSNKFVISLLENLSNNQNTVDNKIQFFIDTIQELIIENEITKSAPTNYQSLHNNFTPGYFSGLNSSITLDCCKSCKCLISKANGDVMTHGYCADCYDDFM